MYTPADQCFAMLMPVSAVIFFIWHCWHYDKLRCLIFSKKEWFRALMCWFLLGSSMFLVGWAVLGMIAAYHEYYVYVGETIPAPSQLWGSSSLTLLRVSNSLLVLGWAFLQSVHLEEFVYWGYLITSISTPGGPTRTWVNSIFFKGWIAGSLAALGLLIGALCMETHNVDIMKANVILAGACLAITYAIASLGLCIVVPGFINKIRRQGAPTDVIDRMLFFQEMNELRTGFRVVYSICFLILASDGLTAKQVINRSTFWCDILYITGLLGIFAATCLSIIIILPRDMASESGPDDAEKKAQGMAMYRRPTTVGGAMGQRQFIELGDRLNVRPDVMADNFAAWEMTSQHVRPKYDDEIGPAGGYGAGAGAGAVGGRAQGGGGDGESERPFAATADRSRNARMSEMPALPTVVQKFRSPLETAPLPQQGPSRVFVTSHTVIEEE